MGFKCGRVLFGVLPQDWTALFLGRIFGRRIYIHTFQLFGFVLVSVSYHMVLFILYS